MSVKIYDSTIGAFKDTETPLIWDEQAQAWKDSAGLVWNESAQAWEERWGGDKLEEIVKEPNKMSILLSDKERMVKIFDSYEEIGLFNQDVGTFTTTNMIVSSKDNGSYRINRSGAGHNKSKCYKKFSREMKSCFMSLEYNPQNLKYNTQIHSAAFGLIHIIDWENYYGAVSFDSGFGVECARDNQVSSTEQTKYYFVNPPGTKDKVNWIRYEQIAENSEATRIILAYSNNQVGIVTKDGYRFYSVQGSMIDYVYFAMAFFIGQNQYIDVNSMWIEF